MEVCHLQQKVADLSSSRPAQLQTGAHQQRPLSAPEPAAGPAGGPRHDCLLLPFTVTALEQCQSNLPLGGCTLGCKYATCLGGQTLALPLGLVLPRAVI